MHFPPGSNARCAVLVQVPMKQLATTPEPGRGSRAPRYGRAAEGLIRNVVQKFSQICSVRRQRQEGRLATGNFTFIAPSISRLASTLLETAVADYEANKAGAQRISFTSPRAEKGVRSAMSRWCVASPNKRR